MNQSEKVTYLPFNAINQFMRDDYRLAILQEVFSNLDRFSNVQRALISKLFAGKAKIQGFRNASQAPLPIRIKHSPEVFEHSAEFSAVVIECWSSLHPQLKSSMVEILLERNWTIQPVEDDRSKLPGFRIDWPKTDSFELLIQALHEKNPDLQESDDNISLMAVWMGNRLPYNLYGDEESKKD